MLRFLLELVPSLLIGFWAGRRHETLSTRLASPLVRFGVPISVMGLLLKGGLSGDMLQAAGLAVLNGELAVDESAAAFLTTRYTRPSARLALGYALRDCATSCIDISDGLLADAAHIASASGVGLEIDSALLPLSKALRSSADLDQRLDWALAGGDDYELLFTLPDNMPLPDGCTEIGRVIVGSGISCDRTPERIGYDHFRR